MKYKDALKASMEMLSLDEKVRFIGYNIRYGSRAYGTLSSVPFGKCFETPLAENLMTGLAIGMAIEGYLPVLFFERHDFLLNGLDGIVNHLDKLEKMSLGEYNPRVIIRAVVGGKKPLNPGLQHTQDFTNPLRSMIHFPVIDLKQVSEIIPAYGAALNATTPVMIIERKDLFDTE
jgi:acetoin:2,6-dichlorophenolindophenol oxidoreductase subunit beta